MTDLLGQDPQLTDQQTPTTAPVVPGVPSVTPAPPAAAPVLPGLDLGAIDNKLRTIGSIEQTWQLPPLPDEVKLDLASQHQVDHKGVSDFLWGLASDINKAVNPLASSAAAADTLTSANPGSSQLQLPSFDPNSTDSQVKRLFAGVTGEPAPTGLASDATVALKRKAVSAGLLPADTPMDQSWDPALESVRYQLQQQDYQKRLSGAKPGSFSVNQVVNFLGDWLTPSSLGKAAVTLGFVPSGKAIKQDVAGGWHALSNWIHHPADPKAFLGVLHASADYSVPGLAPAESAVDHVLGKKPNEVTQGATGIQLPVLNDILLVSGVSEVVAAGRAAVMGDEAYQAARAGIYGEQAANGGLKGMWSSKMLAAGPQLDRTAEASKLSQYLFRGGTAAGDNLAGKGLQGTGLAMQQWRDLKAVQVAKVTAGMLARRGILTTAESKLFPDTNIYAGNPVASAVGVTNDKTLTEFKRAKLPYGIGQVWDLALAPPSYFQPGTFSQIGTPAKQLFTSLHTVNDDVRLTNEVAQGVRSTITDPERLAQFEKTLRSAGPKAALIDYHGGDEDLAALHTTWATAVAAIERDAVARAAGGIPDKSENPAGWESAFWNVKKGTVAQVSHLDEGDTIGFLDRVAANSGDDDAVRRWVSYLNENPDEAQRLIGTLIEHHNGMRNGVLQSLISQLQPGDVSSHIQRFFNTDASFENFLAAHDEIHGLFSPDGLMGASARVIDGVPGVDDAAKVYVKQNAKRLGLSDHLPIRQGLGADTVTGQRIADAYDELPSYDPAAEPSYRAFVKETGQQYNYLTKKLGVTVVPVDADPYASPAEMMADVRDNKTLKVMKTQTTGSHPFMTDEQNDQFRAVHDYFGHAGLGNDFSRHGEEIAWARHAQMYSDAARGAMTTETRGQNSWLNFSVNNQSRKMAGLESEFPEQKVALLPDEFWHRADAYVYTPTFRPAMSPAGRVLGGSNAIDPAANVSKQLLNIMRENPDMVTDSWQTPMARPIGSGQYTAAALHTPVKQDADTLLAAVNTQKRVVDSLQWLESRPDAQQQFAALIKGAGRPLSEVSRDEWAQAVQDAWSEAQGEPSMLRPDAMNLTFQPGPSPKTMQAAKTLHNAAGQTDEFGNPLYDFTQTAKTGSGVDVMPDVTAARQAAEARLAELGQSPEWERMGVASRHDLDTKVKHLSGLRNFMAAEVTGLPQATMDHLNGLGYKVVYGGNFIMPRDVLDNVRPLAEVSHLARARMSLGSFITPAADSQVGRLVGIKLHSEMTDALVKAGAVDPAAAKQAMDTDSGGTAGDVIRRLWAKVDEGKDTTEKLVQQSRDNGQLSKLIANFQSSKTAMGIRDLTMAQMRAALPEFADDQRAMNLIYGAVKNGYDVGGQYQGLQHLEDHWRSRNVITSALKTFGKTEPGNRVERAVLGAGIGAVAGGLAPLVAGQGLAAAAKQAAGGAAIGAGFGALGDVGSRGLAGALPGAVAGGIAAGATGHPFTTGAIGGALAGAGLGIGAGPALADKLLPMVEGSSWYRYGYLPEGLAKMRNYSRFTLSPFFDLRRYVKGALLAQTAHLPEDVSLPLNNSLQALARAEGAGAVAQAKDLWNAATDGQYGLVEDTERFFAQRGILGYSPQEQMATINYRLIKQGVDPEQAHDITRKILAYGTGRSPLEKSVNFIFFPFSFEKKVIQNAGRYLGEDMTRLALLHDAMQTYNTLNQRYDLSKMWQDHLPILEDLQKLNALDHGISPGEFGGVNAPILNFFKPQLMSIEGASDAHSLQQKITRLLPAYNDIDRLTQDLASQGHVMFSPSHQTAAAEADAGFAAWTKLKGEVDRAAQAAGYKHGYTSIYTTKALKPVKDYVEQQKAQLFTQYPGFEKTLLDAGRAKDQRSAEMLQMTEADPSTLSPAQKQLVAFDGLIEQTNKLMASVGIDTSDPSNTPPGVAALLRQRALQYATTGQGFEQLYNRYYRRELGPISKEL